MKTTTFHFNGIGNAHDNALIEGLHEMKEKEVPYPLRFKSPEKYLYISRIAFFHQQSINETVDKLVFGRDWPEKNEEYKTKQKKLGISDLEIKSRRKKRLRRWWLKHKTSAKKAA